MLKWSALIFIYCQFGENLRLELYSSNNQYRTYFLLFQIGYDSDLFLKYNGSQFSVNNKHKSGPCDRLFYKLGRLFDLWSNDTIKKFEALRALLSARCITCTIMPRIKSTYKNTATRFKLISYDVIKTDLALLCE